MRNKDLAQSILDAINNVDSAKSIEDICNLKKLSGHRTAFRIRSGDPYVYPLATLDLKSGH